MANTGKFKKREHEKNLFINTDINSNSFWDLAAAVGLFVGPQCGVDNPVTYFMHAV